MGKTTAVLGLVAAAMLAFIFLFERGTLSSGQLEERKGRVLGRFVGDRVVKLEVQRKGTLLVLARRRTSDPTGPAEWVMEKPYSAKADKEKADSLFSSLEWLASKRKFERVSAEDRKRFGFDAPSARVWYTVDNKRVPVVVGNREPLGDGYYLQTDDPSEAFVVGKDFFEGLNRDPGEYYTKELHGGLSAYTTNSITLRDEEGERVLSKRDRDWWLTKPVESIASAPAVEELISALDQLRAKRFIAERIEEPDRYGLDAPAFEALVEEEAKGGAKAGAPLDLRVGSKCGEQAGESYFSMGRTGPVTCVADADLAKARKGIEALRDRSLLTFEDETYPSVTIDDGTRRVELRSADSKWSFAAGAPGKGAASGEVDSGAVDAWLKALRSTKAESFLEAGEAASRAKQFGSPRLTITFARVGGRKNNAIKVLAVQGGRIYVRRSEEPAVAVYPESAGALLSASYSRFRKLRLLDENEAELSRLEVRRAAAAESLIKKGDEWRIEQPVQVAADRTMLGDLTGQISKLQAVRFIADAAESGHGLDKPTMVVTATFSKAGPAATAGKPGARAADSGTRSYTLRIGNPTDGGSYAQLGLDQAVFVVSSALVEKLSQPLVSRSLLATPTEQLESIKISKRGRPAVKIQRQADDAWTAAGAALKKEEAQKIAERIANLRVSGVTGYGGPSIMEGMRAPRAGVFIVRKPDASAPLSYEILIGYDVPAKKPAKKTSAAQVQVYVRRTDLPVGFTLTAGAVRDLLDIPSK